MSTLKIGEGIPDFENRYPAKDGSKAASSGIAPFTHQGLAHCVARDVTHNLPKMVLQQEPLQRLAQLVRELEVARGARRAGDRGRKASSSPT